MTQRIAEATCEELVLGNGGNWWGSMTITLLKRGGRWDIGETLSTARVDISFDLKLRLFVKCTKGRGLLRELACPAMSLPIVGVSALERAEAVASVPVVAPVTKRKHRSSRRGLYMHEGDSRYLRSRGGRIASKTAISTFLAPTTSSTGYRSQAHSSFRQSHSPTTIDIFRIRSVPHYRSAPPRARRQYPASKRLADRPHHSDTTPFTDSAKPCSKRSTFVIATIRICSIPGSTETSALPRFPDEFEDSYESLSILRRFQSTGRRVSTTTSEEEEVQPSRSRQRLDPDSQVIEPERRLPSLDVLGFGLPQVPDDRPPRRPRTAPMYSSTFARNVPPPLSGSLSTVMEAAASACAARPSTSLGRLPSQN